LTSRRLGRQKFSLLRIAYTQGLPLRYVYGNLRPADYLTRDGFAVTRKVNSRRVRTMDGRNDREMDLIDTRRDAGSRIQVD
jgi:hypothetical protein